ncbi:lysophospholipid acyltransferase family protein [Endozoicomonas sp. ONNA2]|uniref:lysophospholipid acyltransferase family protein n=1 Tax=Endozoicomonas sp. ONNA2 TaxID=2828741 RepID=UPI002148D8C2|nr:lysophospholipid acyltransferase family protein [Endozoicomonas sp. ONNA2]
MLIAKFISYLPFKVIYILSYLLYLLIFYLYKYRIGTVHKNLRQAFPEKKEAYIDHVTRQFYRHFSNLALEVIKAHSMSAETFKERCSIVGADALEAASLGRSRPIIVLTIHQGNWEWMLHGVSQHLGVPIDPVYKPLHHKGWNQFIHKIRSRFHSRPIPMKRAGRDILKCKSGFRLFVMLADQTPVEGERSYWVPYLNKEAPFYLGAEKIALLTQYPVFFAQCRRLKPGYYELEFKTLALPPYENTKDQNHHPIIDAYVSAAQAAIYEQPETFLWSHRRWKRNRKSDE